MQKPKRKENCCFYCERSFGIKYKYILSPLIRTKDHIHPKSKGGLKTKQNIIDACNVCNKYKANMLLPEFLAWIQRHIKNKGTKAFPLATLHIMRSNVIRLMRYCDTVAVTVDGKSKEDYISIYRKVKIISKK